MIIKKKYKDEQPLLENQIYKYFHTLSCIHKNRLYCRKRRFDVFSFKESYYCIYKFLVSIKNVFSFFLILELNLLNFFNLELNLLQLLYSARVVSGMVSIFWLASVFHFKPFWCFDPIVKHQKSHSTASKATFGSIEEGKYFEFDASTFVFWYMNSSISFGSVTNIFLTFKRLHKNQRCILHILIQNCMIIKF